MGNNASIAGALVALLTVHTGHAAEPLTVKPLKVGRPCVAADVVGLWETVDVRASQLDAAQHYSVFQKDYIRFSDDGGFMYFGTPESLKDARRVNQVLDKIDRADGVTYKALVRPDHALIIFRDGQFFQGFTCTITDIIQGKGRSEAMVWTELEGFPAVRRVQVRMG